MKPVLIGSRAVAYWFPDFKPREDSDWDFVCEPQELDVPGRIEWHDPEYLENKYVVYGDRDSFQHMQYCVATPGSLAVLYRSHLHRPEKWDHNIAVYHKFLKPYRYLHLEKALERRKKLTYEAFGNRHPKLAQSNEDFFDDNVEKVYDHDYLHELYAYGDRPMFEKLKREGEEDKAWCVKDLWNELTYQEKCRCVAEETYVIATERFMVPNRWDFNPRQAYYRALRKVCTTLTSGWFRDFAIDNFPEVWSLYDPNRFATVIGKLK
jgi:hypothetical protein